MSDLIEWLRAQLDEVERLATLAGARHVDRHGQPFWPRPRVAAVTRDTTDEGLRAGGDLIAYHDPARVLRQVQAARLMIDQHGRYGAICDECGSADDPVQWPCPTLRLLALPYSDHPDYREEWLPW